MNKINKIDSSLDIKAQFNTDTVRNNNIYEIWFC